MVGGNYFQFSIWSANEVPLECVFVFTHFAGKAVADGELGECILVWVMLELSVH